MASAPPVVLSIAGFDPSSGAGISADIKTIAAHGCYGIACITALTVQSTTGVRRVQPVAPDLVRETLAELATDFEIAAIRIGMLGSGKVASAVADFLEERRPKNVVLDPILSSSSGAKLLDDDGVEVLRTRLLRLAAVITPNLEEAATLTGAPVDNLEGMEHAAEKLHALGAATVVITGGHLVQPADLLSVWRPAGAQHHLFFRRRVESTSTHGTGCAFATAAACNLALGKSLRDVVGEAGEFVAEAIAAAPNLGHGKGPMNHLHTRNR